MRTISCVQAVPHIQRRYDDPIQVLELDTQVGMAMGKQPFSLSAREYEVLMWAARGKTYNDIGLILNLSFGSVKTYLDATRLKLRATNVTHAVALAFATGLITTNEFHLRTTLSDFAPPQRTAVEREANEDRHFTAKI